MRGCISLRALLDELECGVEKPMSIWTPNFPLVPELRIVPFSEMEPENFPCNPFRFQGSGTKGKTLIWGHRYGWRKA